MPFSWTKQNIDFLKENYPDKGNKWCCEKLNLSSSQIRYKASHLKLTINKDSFLNSKQASIQRSVKNSKLHELGILGGGNAYSNCKRGWYDYNGKRYFMRSQWELNYACYLNFLIKQKEILDWEYEVDIFRFTKIKQGVVSYKPDFKIYNNNGSIEYHEVKGWMDSRSKTKLKRMAKYYPDIKLVIITEKEYNAIAKNKNLFIGWSV